MEKTILTVDDSASIRKFMTLALKVQGYRILTAEDGMHALEILPNEQVDLIITDLNMPNVDGFELIRTVRENEAYKEIPIVILTSLADDQDIETGMQLGANSYLIKPFNVKRIQYEVSKYLS